MTSERQWVFYFSEPLPEGAGEPRELLGGKGASLRAMIEADLPVPPGFTISTECCRHFFEHDHTWPETLERQVRENLERLESDMGRRFGRGSSPLLVSVRSGAAVSMPGMMDTLLNVGLRPGLAGEVPDEDQFWQIYVEFIAMFAHTAAELEAGLFSDILQEADQQPSEELAERAMSLYEERAGRRFPRTPWELLAECIDTVFRSWKNERAVKYRERNKVRNLPGTAVTVQAMFPSRVSGILFTQDPNTLSAERMIIEASYGLGEAVVSGNVSPDRYSVSREDLGDFESTVGKKTHAVRALGDETEYDPDAPCLTTDQIRKICEIGLRIEDYFDMPMDIEWGLAEGEFALLQSRAIRGLEVTQDVEVAREEAIEMLDTIAGDEHRVWVIHNLAETLPCPTPLTWDIIRDFMKGDGGFGRMYQELGYSPSDAVRENGFLELICGRIYADPERMAQLFWGDMPLVYDVDQVVSDPRKLEQAPDNFDADRVDGRFLLGLPGLLWSMFRSARRLKELRRDAADRFENRVLPPYLEYVKRTRDKNLAELGDDELLAELDERRGRVLNEFGAQSLLPGFVGGLALQELTELLRRLGGDDGAALANTLTVALEGDLSIEQDVLLHKVASGEATMQEFLDRYGHRTVGEMELMEPRWREDPSYLEQIAARMRRSDGRSPEDIHRDNAVRHEAAEEELPERLAEWGGRSFAEDIDNLLRQARGLLPYRENGKYYLMMGYELIRQVILELSDRWALGDDIFFLTRTELDRFPRAREELENTIAARKVRHKAVQRLEMPDVIDSRNLENLGLPEEVAETTDHLEGDGVAAGVATGTARIVFDPREAGELGVEYVLVCPSTDPGWASLFADARALIVERGGALSHGAIVARDFGIPAVVCPQATSRIPEGAVIRVDGNRGIIAILED